MWSEILFYGFRNNFRYIIWWPEVLEVDRKQLKNQTLWLSAVIIKSFFFSRFLIHDLPWIWGSIKSGYREALVTIRPFWIERSSVGSPCNAQSPMVAASVRKDTRSRSSVYGICLQGGSKLFDYVIKLAVRNKKIYKIFTWRIWPLAFRPFH